MISFPVEPLVARDQFDILGQKFGMILIWIKKPYLNLFLKNDIRTYYYRDTKGTTLSICVLLCTLYINLSAVLQALPHFFLVIRLILTLSEP